MLLSQVWYSHLSGHSACFHPVPEAVVPGSSEGSPPAKQAAPVPRSLSMRHRCPLPQGIRMTPQPISTASHEEEKPLLLVGPEHGSWHTGVLVLRQMVGLHRYECHVAPVSLAPALCGSAGRGLTWCPPGGYVIQGHMPAAAGRRLLGERQQVKGNRPALYPRWIAGDRLQDCLSRLYSCHADP